MARPKQALVTVPPAAPEAAGKLSRAEQAKLAEWRAEAEMLMRDLGMTTGYSAEAVAQYANAQAGFLRSASYALGAALLIYRAMETTQRFRELIDQIGISEGSAFNAMALARHVAKSDGHKKILTSVGSTKALSIFRALTDEDIGNLAEDDAQLEVYATENVKGVIADLKDKTAKVESLAKIIERKDKKINDLEERLERGASLDAEQKRAEELLKAYSAAAGEAHAWLIKVEEFSGEIYALRKKAGHTFKVGLNETLIGHVELLANVVSRLQQFG